jgi:serine protease AprX
MATLFLALLGPALADADSPNAGGDGDGDKVTDDLESHIAALPDDAEVKLIVSLDRAATASRVRGLERAVGDLDVKQRFTVVDAVALTATKDQVRDLAAQGVVDRVERDLPVHAADDGMFHSLNDSAQASFGVTEAQLDAPLLDGDADGDPSTYSADDEVAAVIDTGIDASHVDLDGGKVLAFEDCSSGTCVAATPYDDDGHGTHVAATIAGEGEGDSRYRGVAPRAALVGVKVLDANGDGETSDVVAGIQWVIDHKDDYGIEAINLSLGTTPPPAPAPVTDVCSDGLGADSAAANDAWDAGLVVMAAAGNYGPTNCTIGSPGAAKNVVTVGSMADLGALGFKQARTSSRGPTLDNRIKPDVSAPGVGIMSAGAGTTNRYVTMSGTSMATPFVAGVALLMLQASPSYTNDQVKATIKSSAIDWGGGGPDPQVGTTGFDVDYGAGRLDAYAALAAVDPALTTPPRVPRHEIRSGSLSGTGQILEYTVDVAETTFPVAATMIEVPTACSAASADFDMQLLAPNGTLAASATGTARQDELGYGPITTGVYKLRVYSYSGCGSFFVDISGGNVSSSGASNPDDPKSPAPSTPVAPATTPPKSVPVATAALVNAARVTARRATARLRQVGLRRLLRRGRLTFAGVSAAPGRVALAVRMKVRGKRVLVARATRRVTAAGQPRLTVRLTRAGRRLLAHKRIARMSVRAAVSDATRRRTADKSVRVRR